MRQRARGAGLKAGGAGGLTSASRQIHLPIGLAGPRWRGRVPPPPLFLGCLLHLLVVVVPAGSRAGIRDNRAGLGRGLGGRRGQGGTGRVGSVGCGARSRGSCPAARQACSRALARDPGPLPSGAVGADPPRPNGPHSRPPVPRPESSAPPPARLPAGPPDLPPRKGRGAERRSALSSRSGWGVGRARLPRPGRGFSL